MFIVQSSYLQYPIMVIQAYIITKKTSSQKSHGAVKAQSENRGKQEKGKNTIKKTKQKKKYIKKKRK